MEYPVVEGRPVLHRSHVSPQSLSDAVSLDEAPLPWSDQRCQRLRDALTAAYPERQEVKDLVADVLGLEWTKIRNTELTVYQMWKEVMDRAADSGTLKLLLEAVYADPSKCMHYEKIRAAATELETDRSAAIASGTIAAIHDPPWF